MKRTLCITNTKTGEVTHLSECEGEEAAKDFAFCFRMVAKIGAGARTFYLTKTAWDYRGDHARTFDFYMKGSTAPLHYHYYFCGKDVE